MDDALALPPEAIDFRWVSVKSGGVYYEVIVARPTPGPGGIVVLVMDVDRTARRWNAAEFHVDDWPPSAQGGSPEALARDAVEMLRWEAYAL